MLAFPLTRNSTGWDSAEFVPEQENPAITTEMEGGYTVSRPRHTRDPRRSWKLGWKSTTDAEKQLLENFWDAVRGSSDAFTWTDPSTITPENLLGVSYVCRFKPGSKPSYKYMGRGPLRIWDMSCEIEQL